MLSILMGFSPLLMSQDKKEGNGIKVIGRAYSGDSIVLRWAPTGSMAWENGNKYGYTIYRYTLMKDGENIPTIINQNPIRPMLPEQVAGAIEKDPYTALVAQAIHGEDFTISTSGNDLFTAVNTQRERDQRYSFCLLGADLSAKAGMAAGLRYTDHSIIRGEKYLYRIYSHTPPEILKMDTGFYYIDTEEQYILPQPPIPKTNVQGKMVILQWDGLSMHNIYSAYHIEKSSDGGQTFHRINPLPTVQTYSKENLYSFVKYDSLKDEGTPYIYRIQGVNAFGESGPYSEVVEVKGYKPLESNPTIRSYREKENNALEIHWEYPKEDIDRIEQFILLRKNHGSPGEKGKEICRTPTSLNSCTDDNPLPVNYYTVVALSKSGEEKASHPYLVQPEDKTPPPAPENLRGILDSTGVIRIHWNPVEANDLLGYRVFRAYFSEEEFTQLTANAIEQNYYDDTLNLRLLNKQIHYKVMAEDRHFNPSVWSEELTVELPDQIPPSKPLIEGISQEEQTILLHWKAGWDNVWTNIYRQKEGDEQWQYLGNTKALKYTDSMVEPDMDYYYLLTALDEAGNESEPSLPVYIHSNPLAVHLPTLRPPEVDREKMEITLRWKAEETSIDKIQIYRSTDNSPPSLYTTFSYVNYFTDSQLRPNTTYRYILRAVNKNGNYSPYSKMIMINF